MSTGTPAAAAARAAQCVTFPGNRVGITVLLKSGNGNENVGIPTFEFSAGMRQYCLIAKEYGVLHVLKAKFSSARAVTREGTHE